MGVVDVMLTGLLRVRNDERYVGRAIDSFLPVCDQIVVLNDRSTDSTPEICASKERTIVLDSSFQDLNESRDKALLLEAALKMFPKTTHCVLFDSDELLIQQDVPLLCELIATPGAAFSFHILYAWDREDQIRVDGVYGRFTRGSLFRPRLGDSFTATVNGGNFHCGSVPERVRNQVAPSSVRLIHLGYMNADDRMRKYKFYNEIDPNNQIEDCYAHCIQGDPGGCSAEERLKWAGPLEIKQFDCK